jgi:hypothetical protein
MANLPVIKINNALPTIQEAFTLQKQLIEKQFNSSRIFPDRLYETLEASLGFALDWYIKHPVAPLTVADLSRLSELASSLTAKTAKFYVDYNFEYDDAAVLPDLNAGTKTYVGQTYLTDGEGPVVRRRLVQYVPITSVNQDIESSIYAVYTNDVPYTFQSFRFVGLDSNQWGDVITAVEAAYTANYTIADLLYWEYADRASNWMTDQLAASRGLLLAAK